MTDHGAANHLNRRRLLYGGAAAALTGTGAAVFVAADSPAAPAVKEPATTGHPGVVDVVADFGAKGDGTTDDSQAFADAYAYAVSRLDDHTGRTVIDIPPGRFLITRPGALLNGDDPDNAANGLRFRGAGLRISEIVFAPETAADAYLCNNNDMWQNLAFEGLRFTSGTPGASFFLSYSTGGAANYRFTDCEWMGSGSTASPWTAATPTPRCAGSPAGSAARTARRSSTRACPSAPRTPSSRTSSSTTGSTT